MKPKYYPYWIREDYINGLFETSVSDEEILIEKVIRLFKSEKRTIRAMSNVVNKWKKATEHNLTNKSINKIAWLGQAACCYSVKAPDYITKKAWWLLEKEVRDRADKNAKDIIESYEKETWYKCSGGIKATGQIYF